ncbi:MAG: serine/threonine-protein kinase [Alphaproteobacteria bacterium]
MNTPGESTIESIGRYKIEKVLGRGAMGVVYKGYDEGIDRFVAIKTVHRNLLIGEEGADWLQRFRREARAAGRCLHQNIVTIFEFGEQDGMPYIVMEYVEGRELGDMIRGGERLDRKQAIDVVAQVLDALQYAHANAIVHRDIKPGNIIILKDGTVKVTDFGIARIDSTSMTAHGSVVGTPSYMSPEQFTGGEIDRRSDIFSTGVVLFELLTGQKPFPGKSATEVMYKLLNHEPPAVTTLNPTLPIAMNAVVLKALSRNPDDRFATAAEFKSMLQQAAATAPAADDMTVVMPSPPPRPAATPPTPAPGRPAGIDDEATLKMVSDALSYHIGPVAKVVVEQAAKQAASVDSLYDTVATSIANPDERNAFLRGRTGATGVQPTPAPAAPSAPPSALGEISADDIVKVQQELAVHLGPIAKILTKRATKTVGDRNALIRAVAEHIPTDKERAEFFRRLGLR